jgi:hypothetical protein
MQLGIVGGETIGSALVPQQGFSLVGAPSPGGWVTAPSNVSNVAASITITSAATLDWSRYGIFQFLLTNGSGSVTLTMVNASVGQTILIMITQASSHTATTVTYSPSTCLAMATASDSQALTQVDSAVDCIQVTCTGPQSFVAVFN